MLLQLNAIIAELMVAQGVSHLILGPSDLSNQQAMMKINNYSYGEPKKKGS